MSEHCESLNAAAAAAVLLWEAGPKRLNREASDMLKYWVWLSELKGLRNQTRLALLRRFGDPEEHFLCRR